jgi:protocatechuate 3,4-dioxygenase beta subunit
MREIVMLCGLCLTTANIGAWAAAAPTAASSTTALTVICGPEEKGERLRFTGRVFDYRGQPLSEAAVIAYHTDMTGLYNPPNGPTRVPRLRAVAVTDSAGRFVFSTIRPGGYPRSSEPAHIHMMVAAPAHHARYVDIWFDDDRRVTDTHRKRAVGDDVLVIVKLAREAGGAWSFVHDIHLQPN